MTNFVNFAFTFRRIRTFRAIFARGTFNVIFRRRFCLKVLRCTLLRSFKNARRELSGRRMSLKDRANRVGNLFTDHIAAACCNCNLLAMRRAITDNANASARSNVFLLVTRARMFNNDANNSGRDVNFCNLAVIRDSIVKDLFRINFRYSNQASVRTRAFNLLTRIFRRVKANRAFEVTKRVFRFNNSNRLSSQLCTFVRSQ